MVNCTICGDGGAILQERRLSVYRCASCSHVFTSIPKEIQEKYDEDYFIRFHRKWFNNPNLKLYDFMISEALKLNVSKKNPVLLDVGCGNGAFLKHVLKRAPNFKLYGIDLISNKHPHITFMKCDFMAENVELDADIVCALAVIEHVDNPILFVRKIKKLLNSNGLVFVMTINNNSLLYRIARILNKIGMHAAYDRIYSHHHLQHYTNKSLRKLMEMNGFEVLMQKNHGRPLKSVDVPEGSFLLQNSYLAAVSFIFLISGIFGSGIDQTIMCRKIDSRN